MRTGRPKAELVLSEAERTQLQSFVRSRSLPAALGVRARIILGSADGEDNKSIAARLKVHKATVGKWRTSFIQHRIAGLYDGVRPGSARTIDDEKVSDFATALPCVKLWSPPCSFQIRHAPLMVTFDPSVSAVVLRSIASR
jgi:winged helix-turn helix protein